MINPYDAWAQVYDHLTENVEYEARSAYISGFFLQYGVEPGAQVLDLACGTGSLTRVLAERGYEMIGADLSQEMLAQAAEKCRGAGPIEPIFLHQAMEELDLYGTIDAFG